MSAFLLPLLIAPRLNAQIPKPVIGTSAPLSGQSTPSAALWEPMFTFRSGFWVNLQHFLFIEGQLRSGLEIAGDQGNRIPARSIDTADLTPAERAAWDKAVTFYAVNFAGRDMAFDGFLDRIDDRLSDMTLCPDILGRSTPACDAGIDPGVATALEEAAPVYRAHWWNEQNRANLAWISQTNVLLRQYGAHTGQGLAQAFNQLWPDQPIAVDVVPDSGDFGAYATLDPLHIVIGSGNSFNRGLAGLEALYREAALILAAPVQEEIVKECQEHTKPVPRDLWYALAAYTTASVFEKSFADEKLAEGKSPGSLAQDERDYAVARGWQSYQPLLDFYWRPYLDGQTGLEYAIGHIVAAI